MANEANVNPQVGAVLYKLTQALDVIEKTSEKGAATVLFIVGISLLVFIYAVKFFSLPFEREMTSNEFIFSGTLAIILILSGASVRLFVFYVKLNESRQAAVDVLAIEKKTLDRLSHTAAESKENVKPAEAGVV